MTVAIGCVFAGIAGLVWLWLLVNLANLRTSDAAGNGLAEAFAVGTTFVLWLALVALWLTIAIGIGMDWRQGLAVLLLLPGSAAAALAGFSVLTRRGGKARRWPALPLVAAPPIILADSLCRLFPMLLPQPPSPWIAWGAVLLLSLLPWPAVLRR